MFGEKLFSGVGFPTPLSIPDTTTCLIIQVPASDEWWALMVGLLYGLSLEWNWQQFEGGIDRDVAADAWRVMLDAALEIASTTNACDFDVPAPYWDEDSADDADDEGSVVSQPWYGELETDGVTWREQVGIWAITAFLAVTATPAAAIAFLPFANRFVLAFKQHSAGAIVKVLIDGVEMVTADTYAPSDGILNVPISLPAPMGFTAFDTSPQLLVVMTDETNPAVTDPPSMQVIRKRLDVTEITPSNLRWNVDCDCVQQTPDGGTTWVDSPTQDPRRSTLFQVPLRSTGDPQCDSAQQMHDRIKNMLDALIASSDILQAINSVIAVIAIFFFEFGIVIEAIWAIVSAIFSIGTSTLNAALTDAVYDQFLCILFCHIGSDGSVTEAQFNAIKGDVSGVIGGVAATAINGALDSIGWVGLTNAGALGEVTGDCTACGCNWCYNFDFSIDDGGFSVYAGGGGGGDYSGGGWQGTTVGTEKQADISITFTPTIITKISATWDTNGNDGNRPTLILYLAGTQVFRADAVYATGSTQTGAIFEADVSDIEADEYRIFMATTFPAIFFCTTLAAQMHGQGDNPFGFDNCS